MSFTSAISIPGGHTVDIESGGFNVESLGNAATRFFTDSGGTLTLGGLVLEGGAGGAGGAGENGGAGGRRQRCRRRDIPGGPGTDPNSN